MTSTKRALWEAWLVGLFARVLPPAPCLDSVFPDVPPAEYSTASDAESQSELVSPSEESVAADYIITVLATFTVTSLAAVNVPAPSMVTTDGSLNDIDLAAPEPESLDVLSSPELEVCVLMYCLAAPLVLTS